MRFCTRSCVSEQADTYNNDSTVTPQFFEKIWENRNVSALSAQFCSTTTPIVEEKTIKMSLDAKSAQ